MVTVHRSDKTVFVNISLGSIGWNIDFSNTRSTEFDAVLLEKKIKEDMEEFISRLRKHYYNDGWNDKSSKRKPKKEYFSGQL